MLVRKLIATSAFVCLGSCLQLFAYVENFDTSSYEQGIPRGWALRNHTSGYVTLPKDQPVAPPDSPLRDKKGVQIDFYSTTEQNLLYRTVKIPDEVVTDTILAKMEFYEQPEGLDVDSFQIVVSTNAWASYEVVGDSIPIRKKGRLNSEWVSCSRRLRLNGVAEAKRDIYVGILLNPAGQSSTFGYIRSLSVDIAASAMPAELRLKHDGVVVDKLFPADNNLSLSACVRPDPNDARLTLDGVYGVINRNGEFLTNRLFRVDGTDEYTNMFVTSKLDAGETLTVSAFSKYKSTLPMAGVPDQNDSDYVNEDTDVPGKYVVGKLGSVWINELSAERIELAGTTNREMSAGWTVVVANEDGFVMCSAALGDPFNFKTNMINGVVGLDVRELLWDGNVPMDEGPYYVSLYNSRGVAEDPNLEMSFSNGIVKGRVGYAPWHGDAAERYSYDWTGTATDGTFKWMPLPKDSFGTVNDGQGFNVHVSAQLTVKTTDGDGEDAGLISYAKVIATVSDLNNATELGKTKSFEETSVDGYATLTIDGETPFPNEIRVAISGSAFGWTCEKGKVIVLANGCDHIDSLAYYATVAKDDFTQRMSYWKDLDAKLKWEVQSGFLMLNTYSADAGTGRLKCENYLSAHKRKMCFVGFDFRNHFSWYTEHDEFKVVISTNANFSGEIVSSPALSNIRPEYSHEEWYHYQVVFNLPDGFSDAPELWLQLRCDSQGSTSAFTCVDNLEIAFQDVALPTNLTRTVETPVSGGSTGFVLDVLPQTTDKIEEVSADLHITVAGDKWVVPFAFADGSLTNRISIADGDGAPSLPCSTKLTISPEALEKVCGKFYAGQTVSYYAAVHYNSANGDTDPKGVYETRYFPDNAKIETIETTEGKRDYWVVEGGYKAIEDRYGFTVDGSDIEILGAPRIGVGEIGFDYHAWDRTGNKGITNLTLTVEAGEFSTNFVMFAGDATNRVTDAFVVPDLVANTTYKLTLSGQRNTGYDLTSTNYTFTTLGEVTSAAIVGTSTRGVELSVDGLAEKYAVEPSDWVQKPGSTTVWTWKGGSPNTERTATIKAVNSAGATNAATYEVSGFTLAAKPSGAPVVEKLVNTVVVQADEDYAKVTGGCYSDGNPSNTAYAVRVKTSRGADAAYVSNDSGAIWKTLAEWAVGPVTNGSPVIDLTATNTFRFVAQNADGIPAEEDGPESDPQWFDMAASFVGNAAYQARVPFGASLVYGAVAFTNVFFEPATSKQVKVEFDYQLGDTINEKAWVTLDKPDDLIEPADLIDFDELCVTNGSVWNARARVKDDVKTGYFLRATISKDGRSASAVIGGTLDFEKPTVELSSKTHRSPFNTAPLKVDVTFSEDVVGFTKDSVKVGNGTVTAVVTNNASSYTVEITPAGQGPRVVDIRVWVDAGAVTDVYGNENVASKEPKPTWTYDTVPPTVTLTSEALKPFNASESPWEVQVDFSEPVVGFDKNKVKVTKGSATEVVQNNPTNYTVKVAPTAEGDVLVQIEAGKVTDAAGNGNEASSELTRVYDNTAPVLGELTGWPTTWTNTTAFSFAISATDELTPFTYHWTMDEKEVSNATNYTDNVPGEGTYTLSVYAKDAAGNASVKTNSVTWSVDKTLPSDPEIVDKPNKFTREPTYSFTAVAEDDMKQPVVFCWNLDGADGVRALPADVPFSGKFADDGSDDKEHVVTVYTVDAAGNHSKGKTIYKWTFDTTAPVLAEITGTPAEGAVTNGVEYSFSIALKEQDLTDVTFHWLTNGVWAADVTNFSDKVVGVIASEGLQVASVYATDEAGNVSVTNSRTWTVDWTAPSKPVVKGWPADGVVTNGTDFSLSATATDNLTKDVAYHWTLRRGRGGDTASTGNDKTFSGGELEDDDYVASVYATDDAGNVSETATWRWEVDTTKPVNLVLTGTPEDGAVTTSTNFDFTASAEDTTKLTYHWTLTGKEWANTSSNYAGVVSEGTNWVSVFARDAVGNECEPTNRTWIVDLTPPELTGIDGKPAKITNKRDFTLTALATDNLTQMTYHWTFRRGGDTASTEGGATFSSEDYPAAEGENAVSVYVTDEAGNVSATNSYEWVLDTVAPTVVKLESKTPKTFNEYKVPLIVDVTFSEEVVGFDKDSVTVTRGSVTNWTGSGSSYTVYIDPDEEKDDETFVPVTVKVAAKEVADPAGNPNEASEELEFRNVTKLPMASLSTETAAYFNDPSFVVTATFVRGTTKIESAVVTNFTVQSVSVTNGEVTAVSPAFATNVYTFTVKPTKDGQVIVRIPDNVVADEVGNLNVASDPLTLVYDHTAPDKLAISGKPGEGEATVSQDFAFQAAAEDMTDLTYHWTLTTPNGVEVEDFVSSNFSSQVSMRVPQGTNAVSVYAVDAAGNACEPTNRTWIVDLEPPTKLAFLPSSLPAEGAVVTDDTFDLFAVAQDNLTRITYYWTTNRAEVTDNFTTNLCGAAIEGTNTVTVYAMDEASNSCDAVTHTWVVDRIAPTNLVLRGAPAKITRETGFEMTAEADDETILTYHWSCQKSGDGAAGVRALPAGVAFTNEAALADGEYTVTVYATDEANNRSAMTSWTWTVDTTAPEGLAIDGTPAEHVVVANTDVNLTASAADAVTPQEEIVYVWTLDDGKLVESQTLQEPAHEGTNTVSVYAMDGVSNVCKAVTRTWVVDTLAPSNLQFVATLPAADAVTNGDSFAFAVTAEDATQLKYHWLTNGVEVANLEAPAFEGRAVEGTNTVSVYATDEANNVSATNHISWTYDFRGPTTPEIVEGAPRSGATKERAFGFAATATDDWSRTIDFHWSLRRGEDTASTWAGDGQTVSDNVMGEDGTYTMSVWAIDEAGNSSGTNSWSWTLDTTEPVMPTVTGTPETNSYVNVSDFDFTAGLTEDDATAVTYHWTLDEDPTETVVTNFTGAVKAEGVHTVRVYAKDAAGNLSPTNSLSWTYDVTAPVLLGIEGTPADKSMTNGVAYSLLAEATDKSPVIFRWTLDGAPMNPTSEGVRFEGKVAEGFGSHVVTCYAEDKAGNVSAETNVWSWTVDTLVPTNLTVSGSPANGAATTNTAYSFTATALDDLSLTYHWTLDGGNEQDLPEDVAYEGEGLSDGPHTLAVFATDGAGNKSAETKWIWTVDTEAPTDLSVWGLPISGDPEVINLTNGCDFAFTAHAEDRTELTYHWVTNGHEVADCTSSNFVGTVGEGTNWVAVFATDAADNTCGAITNSWIVDITRPTVTLLPDISTNEVVNLADVTPDGLRVAIEFSEPVTGFAWDTVKVDNGTVTAVETNSEASYVVTVKPTENYEGEEFAVRVDAESVMDLAGNGNMASETLTYKCDVKRPTVTLESDMPDPFGQIHLLRADGVLTLTVAFSEPVTNFTVSSVSITNGNGQVRCVVPADGQDNAYLVKIDSFGEGEIPVMVTTGAVADLAGNGNAASEVLARTYLKQPKITVTGTTTTSDGRYELVIRGKGCGEVMYCWRVDSDYDADTCYWVDSEGVGQKTLTGTFTDERTHVITVFVWDDLGQSEHVSWTILFERGEEPDSIDFGGGVTLKVDSTTYETNSVSFKSVDFRPGDVSTFVLSGFDATKETITGLKMLFSVSDALDGDRWSVKVDSNAKYDIDGTKDLTVTIPGTATTDGDKPYESFFIFGVDVDDGK